MNVCMNEWMNEIIIIRWKIYAEAWNVLMSVEGCFRQFKNVGCFADKQILPRPIPELIFTDMNNGSLKYSGREAQLGELDTYLGDVLCRCAEQAQELGYQYFGVQNHGNAFII